MAPRLRTSLIGIHPGTGATFLLLSIVGTAVAGELTGAMVGLDVTLGALTAICKETRDPRWYPPMILRRKVAAGQLGREAGRGWYEYASDGVRKGG